MAITAELTLLMRPDLNQSWEHGSLKNGDGTARPRKFKMAGNLIAYIDVLEKNPAIILHDYYVLTAKTIYGDTSYPYYLKCKVAWAFYSQGLKNNDFVKIVNREETQSELTRRKQYKLIEMFGGVGVNELVGRTIIDVI